MRKVLHIPVLFESLLPAVIQLCGKEVYFQYGHYDAVNKTLIAKDGSITQKDRKYPLVWLVTPYDEKFDLRQDYYCELSGLDILVLTGTNADDDIPTRVEKYYTPTLWPIVDALFQAISDSGLFEVLSPESVSYDYIKDWYYQSGLSGKNNLFNDYIDAVQIKNVKLRVNEPVPEIRLQKKA